MRDALAAVNLEVIGNPSAIVPVLVGDEALARMASRRLPELEVIANLVEYPAVAKGNARFRRQMMPSHSAENVKELASRCAPRSTWCRASTNTTGRASARGNRFVPPSHKPACTRIRGDETCLPSFESA
jgi:hypothetical protein